MSDLSVYTNSFGVNIGVVHCSGASGLVVVVCLVCASCSLMDSSCSSLRSGSDCEKAYVDGLGESG